ncbi:hypothetical protein IV203_035241 [Nitzschia inconspicua]|uniref:Uncharacterized protein n=1 Tax=Nitzschia inconspicua TaxID=303405 RepID=A0A9K3LDM0_9STRA|nr:hypothetical protein IV203_035241 [Nitzschia inconspicua]
MSSELQASSVPVGVNNKVRIPSHQPADSRIEHLAYHHQNMNVVEQQHSVDSENNVHNQNDGHQSELHHHYSEPHHRDPSGQPFPSDFLEPLSHSQPQQQPLQHAPQQRQFHEVQHLRPYSHHEHQHAGHHTTQQHHQHTSEIPVPSDMGEKEGVRGNASNHSRLSKKPRRRYDNDFKSEVLQHLKIPGVKLPTVAKKFKIPENTLREWTKVSAVRAIEVARATNSGQLKANMYDPMHRLASSLKIFFEDNERRPQHLRQPVTTKIIVAKGLEAKQNLLELDRVQPMLDPKERRALEHFTGSDSWAKKFAKRHQLKLTGSRIKELSEEEIRGYHSSLIQMAARIKQAGPRFEEAANLIRQAGEKLQRAQAATVSSDPSSSTRRQLSANTNQCMAVTGTVSLHSINHAARTPHQPTSVTNEPANGGDNCAPTAPGPAVIFPTADHDHPPRQSYPQNSAHMHAQSHQHIPVWQLATNPNHNPVTNSAMVPTPNPVDA